MMEKGIVLIVIAPLIALAVPCSAFAQEERELQDRKPPELLEADDQRPAGRPAEDLKVAVLSIVLRADQGVLRSVEIKSVNVISSFAPKVFARSAGDWRVLIKGERPASYLIVNPLNDIEIENPRASTTPYSAVRPSGMINWELVVPLYKDGQPLGAETIEIVDISSGSVLLNVDLDDPQYQQE